MVEYILKKPSSDAYRVRGGLFCIWRSVTNKGEIKKLNNFDKKEETVTSLLSIIKLITTNRNILVIVTLFNGSDNNVIAVIIVDLNAHAVADLFTKQRLTERRFLGEISLENILTKGGDYLSLLLFLVLLNIVGNCIEKTHGISILFDPNYLGSSDHILEIPNAALIGVLFPLRLFVFGVFAEVSVLSGSLHLCKKLWAKNAHAVVNLLLHLLYINGGQFVVHDFILSK